MGVASGDAAETDEEKLRAWIRNRGHTLRVLVAEDNQTNQLVATQMLIRHGIAADVAANGREAVEAVCAADYDLILMDIQMPEMDGLIATQRIRTLEAGRASIPIVACTANAHAEDVERSCDAGMDDYVAKPFNRSQLAAVLLRVLGRSATRTAPVIELVERGDGPVVDEDVLRGLARSIGPAATRRICALFLSEGEKSIAALRSMHSARDTAALARAAHSLKSAAANVGAGRLSAIARAIEAEPEAAGAVSERIDGIEADFRLVGRALRDERLWDGLGGGPATGGERHTRSA